MSGVGEAAAAVGLSINVINVGYYINRKYNPSKILKYAERKVRGLDKEEMMGKLIEIDPPAAHKVRRLRTRAEIAIEDAKKVQGYGFRKIRVRLLACRTADALCEEFKKKPRGENGFSQKLSAAAVREFNDKRLDEDVNSKDKSAAAAKRQYDNAGLPDTLEECSDPKLNSQALFTCQIPPSSSSAQLVTSMDERGEVSDGPGGLLSVRVKEEMIESVRRGDAHLVAEVLRQNDDTESLNVLAPCLNVSENFATSGTTIPISIQSSNTITVDSDLIMGEIFAMIAG
ncbi:hypothetical protein BDP27DRAFT_1311583 [Rhodocollybia butyracea]|uniref:Uncharacterized protein n=1 Tax=Rhodocollybia butyracea TaxID=206335 RepID=A0A9P5UEX6_9AGAR|nr:hypothetical protein BDP27DRAFT_1311583 [Rhodocollybia butyracea]